MTAYRVGDGDVVGFGLIFLVLHIFDNSVVNHKLASGVLARRRHKIVVGVSTLGGSVHEAQSQRRSEVGTPFGSQISSHETSLLILLEFGKCARRPRFVAGFLECHVARAIYCTHSHIGKRVDGVGVTFAESLERHWAQACGERVEVGKLLVSVVAQHIVASAVEIGPFGILVHHPTQHHAIAVGAIGSHNVSPHSLARGSIHRK